MTSGQTIIKLAKLPPKASQEWYIHVVGCIRTVGLWSTSARLPDFFLVTQCGSQQITEEWHGMVELHLFVVESQTERDRAQEVATPGQEHHSPYSQAQTHTVVSGWVKECNFKMKPARVLFETVSKFQ